MPDVVSGTCWRPAAVISCIAVTPVATTTVFMSLITVFVAKAITVIGTVVRIIRVVIIRKIPPGIVAGITGWIVTQVEIIK